MSNSRCHLKIEFSIYGKKFEWDTGLNYAPNEGDGIDDRIVDWFAECYAEARSAWDHESMLEDEANAERLERQELARLKAKYEPLATLISSVPAQEFNWRPRVVVTNPTGTQGDAPTSGVSFTDAYDGEGSGLCDMEGTGARWRDPTPSGDFTTSGITCRECGCKVTLKAGDMIARGDPRLCEHLGGPKRRGFGMKAGESSPGDITGFTVDDDENEENK